MLGVTSKAQDSSAQSWKLSSHRIPRVGVMGSANSVSIWRTRWILTLTLLLVALAGVGVASVFLPRTYQAGASVVLLASRTESGSTGGNPYLNFSSSLTLTADAVSRQVMDPQTANSLVAHGFPGSYTVAMPTYSTSTVGSVLLITVTGSGSGTVEHTLNGVVSAIRDSLTTLQSGVRPDNQIRMTVLAPAGNPAVDRTHMVRSLAIVAGFGLVVALGLPWLIDAQVSRQLANASADLQTGNEDNWALSEGLTPGDARTR
jgi:hypothetical protein